MNFSIPCMQCQKENGIPSFEFKRLELTDDFYFLSTCSKGHTSITILQNERFEILFDLACESFTNGYYREAVFNAASSIERFHEFFVKVITIKNLKGVPDYDNFIDTTWKELTHQSERQLGAFYMVYLNEFKSVPPIFDKHKVTFRNNIIHKGAIPSKDKTYDYLKYAFGYIKNLLRPLKNNYNDYINLLTFKNLRDIRKSAQNKYPKINIPPATFAAPSVISLISGEKNWYTESFDESLSKYIDGQKHLEYLPFIKPSLDILLNFIPKK